MRGRDLVRCASSQGFEHENKQEGKNMEEVMFLVGAILEWSGWLILLPAMIMVTVIYAKE